METNKIIALTPVIEGQTAEIELNGKTYKRIVRYNRKVGLYVVINGYKYFEYEMDYKINKDK